MYLWFGVLNLVVGKLNSKNKIPITKHQMPTTIIIGGNICKTNKNTLEILAL